MADKNGSLVWVRWLAGILVTAVVLVALPTIATNMIQNDKDSRTRDGTLREKIDSEVTVLRNNVYSEIKEMRQEQKTIGEAVVRIATLLEGK